jgi:hypothetical protein
MNDSLRVFPSLVHLRLTRPVTVESSTAAGYFWLALPAVGPARDRPAIDKGAPNQDPAAAAKAAEAAAAVKTVIEASEKVRKDGIRLVLHALDLRDVERNRTLRLRDTIECGPVPGAGAPVRWTVPLAGANTDTACGAYRGYLLASRTPDQGTDIPPPLPIPVLLEVRDPPGAALVILALGALIQGLLAAYPKLWMRDDELLADLGDRENLVLADPALASPDSVGVPFRRRFGALFREVAVALETGNVEGAASGLQSAATHWGKWSMDRDVWVAALGRVREAIDRLEREEEATANVGRTLPRHPASLLKRLFDHYFAAPDRAAGTYEAESLGYLNWVERYFRVRGQIDAARALALRVPDPTIRTRLLQELGRMRSGWEVLDGTEDLRSEEERIQEGLGQVRSAAVENTPPAERAESESAPSFELGVRTPAGAKSEDLLDSGELIPRSIRARVESARTAQAAYVWTPVVITYVGLILLGYQQTYDANPTFGADRLKDYSSVALWAFGASVAARAASLTLSTGLFQQDRAPQQPLTSPGGSGSNPTDPSTSVGSPEAAPLVQRRTAATLRRAFWHW